METWWIGNMFDFPEGHRRTFWVSPTAGSAANSKRSPSERPKPEVCLVLAGAKTQSQKQPLRNPSLSLRIYSTYIYYIYTTCNTFIYISLCIINFHNHNHISYLISYHKSIKTWNDALPLSSHLVASGRTKKMLAAARSCASVVLREGFQMVASLLCIIFLGLFPPHPLSESFLIHVSWVSNHFRPTYWMGTFLSFGSCLYVQDSILKKHFKSCFKICRFWVFVCLGCSCIGKHLRGFCFAPRCCISRVALVNFLICLVIVIAFQSGITIWKSCGQQIKKNNDAGKLVFRKILVCKYVYIYICIRIIFFSSQPVEASLAAADSAWILCQDVYPSWPMKSPKNWLVMPIQRCTKSVGKTVSLHSMLMTSVQRADAMPLHIAGGYIYKIGIYFKTYVGYQLHMWGITMISVGIWIILKSDLWRLDGITAWPSQHTPESITSHMDLGDWLSLPLFDHYCSRILPILIFFSEVAIVFRWVQL